MEYTADTKTARTQSVKNATTNISPNTGGETKRASNKPRKSITIRIGR